MYGDIRGGRTPAARYFFSDYEVIADGVCVSPEELSYPSVRTLRSAVKKKVRIVEARRRKYLRTEERIKVEVVPYEESRLQSRFFTECPPVRDQSGKLKRHLSCTYQKKRAAQYQKKEGQTKALHRGCTHGKTAPPQSLYEGFKSTKKQKGAVAATEKPKRQKKGTVSISTLQSRWLTCMGTTAMKTRRTVTAMMMMMMIATILGHHS